MTSFYEAPIFGNISESEQRHMDAVRSLIEKYGLVDPVANDEVGEFTNTDFAEFYKKLVEDEEINYCDALQVGIDIEVLDIEDIENALNDENVVARDVTRVFSNLLNGSYNHLNAFTSRYEANCK